MILFYHKHISIKHKRKVILKWQKPRASVSAVPRNAKITAAKERIKSLEAKKQEILAPKAPRKPRKTKKQKIQEIVKLAMKNGMSVEEVASQLHVEVES